MKTREEYLTDAFELLRPMAFSFVTEWPDLKFSISDFRTKEADKVKKQKEKDKMRAMYEQGTM